MVRAESSRPSLLVVGVVTAVVVVGGMFAWFLIDLIVFNGPKPDHALLAENHQIVRAEAQRLAKLRVGGMSGRVIRDFYPCGYDMGVTVQTPYMAIRWDPPASLGDSALDDMIKKLQSYGYTYDPNDEEPIVSRDGVHTVNLQRQNGPKVISVSVTQAEKGVKLWRAEYPESEANPFPTLTLSMDISPSGCDTRFPD